MRILVLLLLVAIAFSGCEKATQKNDLPVGEIFSIKYQQKLENSDQHITLLLDSVRNDSRCPANVECVWAGNAEVKFIMGISNIEFILMLNTNLEPKKLNHPPYTIELISLSPAAGNNPIILSNYTAQVKITKN